MTGKSLQEAKISGIVYTLCLTADIRQFAQSVHTKSVRTAKVLSWLRVCTKETESFSVLPLFYRESGGRGPLRERVCFLRTKLSHVSVYSSLAVLHFAEKETGSHLVVSLYKKRRRKT